MERTTPTKSVLFFVFALIAGLLLFLGLPLLGWGLGKIPQFFADPARLAYAILILGLQLFGILYNPRAGKNKDDRKSDVKRYRIDLILIQIFSLTVVILAPFSDGHSFGAMNYGDVIRFLGFLLVIPGFVLMQMAEKYLDKNFSIEVTLQKGHNLVHKGPYQYIRHPRYLGILALFLGIAIVFRSWVTILAVIILGAIFIWRTFVEDVLMKQEFGEEWEAYAKKSWRMIPFVF